MTHTCGISNKPLLLPPSTPPLPARWYIYKAGLPSGSQQLLPRLQEQGSSVTSVCSYFPHLIVIPKCLLPISSYSSLNSKPYLQSYSYPEGMKLTWLCVWMVVSGAVGVLGEPAHDPQKANLAPNPLVHRMETNNNSSLANVSER